MLDIPAKEATQLILSGRAPIGLRTGVLHLGLPETKNPISFLPAGLRCYSLSLAGQPIAALPSDLQVEYKINLTDCSKLTALPTDLKVSSLVLTNCTRLNELPEGLHVYFLQLDGCSGLRRWPENAQVVH